MKRVIAGLVLGAVMVGCGATPAPSGPVAQAPNPTAQIIYVTPAPPAATPIPTPAEVTPPPEPTETPPTNDGIIPFKTVGTLGDWSVRLTSVNFDAARALQKANQFNDPIPKGMKAVLIYANGVYNGDGRESFDGSDFRAVGPSGVEYTSFTDPTCGVLPEPDIEYGGPTLRKGGTFKGYIACYVVDQADVAKLQLFYSDLFGTELTYFALR